MKQNIQIDREFMNLSVLYTEEEQENLERSLMREGCREPIITWRGVILDGHKRYKFCGYEDIDYEILEMEFDSREEAVIWICRERVAGLTRHKPMYRYLVGKWYNMQKQMNKEKRKQEAAQELIPLSGKHKPNSVWDTSSRLGEELGVCHSTVEDCGTFARVLDWISDIEPVLFEAILKGEVHFKQADIRQMVKMDEKDIREIKRKKLGRKDVKMRRRNKMDAWDKKRGEESMEDTIQLKTGIKEMPAFDPDMEIKGLTLTIPTWINVIARTERKADMAIVTDSAKEQLAANLARLQEQIDHTLEVITCTKTEH